MAIPLYLLASAILLSAVIGIAAYYEGSRIMSAATDRLNASLAASTASQDALRAALDAARTDNGDVVVNAAADALDAETAKNEAAIVPPVVPATA